MISCFPIHSQICRDQSSFCPHQAGFASSSDSAVSMPAEPSSDDSRSDQGSMSPLQVLSHQNVTLRVYQWPRALLRLMKWNIGCWSFWSRRRRLIQHLQNQGSQMRFSFSKILKKRTAKLKMKKNNRKDEDDNFHFQRFLLLSQKILQPHAELFEMPG